MEKEEIRQARESLRKIYSKYYTELYNIVYKIDNQLGVLEENANI